MEVPNIKLLIAGDGPLRVTLKKLCEDLGIADRVSLLGMLHDIDTFLSKIDIFVLSSIREGIPLSLLEAMAIGKPVIATAVGGIPEVIDNGMDGILIKSANVTQLKEAIISLILNEEKRTKLAKNARKKVLKHFSFDKTVQEISSLYEELLNKA